MSNSLEFSQNDYVVYPSHGVGKIEAIEKEIIAGFEMEMFVIHFEKDKMTLRVPTSKADAVGMRSLSSPDIVGKAMSTLRGRARVKRAMWSRRAQEYDQKINSGDIKQLSEVVRDLFRKDDQTEQSYSERQMFQIAFERYTREFAISSDLKFEEASSKILEILNKR